MELYATASDDVYDYAYVLVREVTLRLRALRKVTWFRSTWSITSRSTSMTHTPRWNRAAEPSERDRAPFGHEQHRF